MKMNEEARTRRSVRSFVRRAGRMTGSQTRAIAELWPQYGIEFSPHQPDLDAFFGRKADRVLEIGFGNGDTLVQSASANPELDFIGIEVHEPGIGHCLIMADNAGIRNLRIIAHDAVEVLQEQLAPASLARINLYFPDPWPKKRHHKRRIVQPGFLELAASRLVSGGTFHVATDWQNYAEHIDEVFAASDRFRLDERRTHSGDHPLDRFTTKFERRGLNRGHRIRDWRFVRV